MNALDRFKLDRETRIAEDRRTAERFDSTDVLMTDRESAKDIVREALK